MARWVTEFTEMTEGKELHLNNRFPVPFGDSQGYSVNFDFPGGVTSQSTSQSLTEMMLIECIA